MIVVRSLATLDEVKRFADEFLKRQLEMSQMISTLSVDDVNRFNEWYTTNPYHLKLEELMAIIQRQKK